MEKRSIQPLLAENAFFSGMSAEHLELIADCGSNVRFEANTHILREGDEAKSFYVIRHGRVAVEVYSPQGGAIAIQTLQEGDVVGFSALFPPYRWNFDARATQLTRALAFNAMCLRDKFRAEPDLGYELSTRFARVMLERLQATRLQLLDVYGNA